MQALELPKLTFPVLGLLVGHPDQEPGQKPRMPLSVMTAENTYPRLESFSHLVATNIGVGGAHVSPIMEVLHEQGLCLR